MSCNIKKLGLVMVVFVCAGALLTSCASVNKAHPQLVAEKITEEKVARMTAEQASEVATVYIIRPRLMESKGIADMSVHIAYQGQPLLKMDEDSYALLYLWPSKGEVRVSSKTLFARQKVPIDVWRSRQYKFIAGKTYFIHVRQIDEEFRGVFYDPEPVSLEQAKVLIENAGASGAAKFSPIEKLTEVNVPPSSAVTASPPPLPEDVYRQETYMYEDK